MGENIALLLTQSGKNEVHADEVKKNTPLACECKNNVLENEATDNEQESERYKNMDKYKEMEALLRHKMESMKERFDFVLQHEQTRAAHMLCQEHRIRQERIKALKTQLECRNMAGLMYVVCSERRKSKLEKLRMCEEYNKYINQLNDILKESQDIILNLSRGFKTAARVDAEWRCKTHKIVNEFKNFLLHFTGGTPETNEFFFDLPKLMEIESPIHDNPGENPIDEINPEPHDKDLKTKKEWFERLGDKDRPFVIYGDMSNFKPDPRREVLKQVKAVKTAPVHWREYAFHDMYMTSNCPNLAKIKHDYEKVIADKVNWECQAVQVPSTDSVEYLKVPRRRTTLQSIDAKNTMGSILKMITINTTTNTEPVTKAVLLGARDSMEILSTTRLLKEGRRSKVKHSGEVVINIGHRRPSETTYSSAQMIPTLKPGIVEPVLSEGGPSSADLPKLKHTNSLEILTVKPPGHRFMHRKECPVDDCQRMKIDSFTRSLPHYMWQGPNTHYFMQSSDNYETCSPEQLAILKNRIEARKKLLEEADDLEENLQDEWREFEQFELPLHHHQAEVQGSCECAVPETPETSRVFQHNNLGPVKRELDRIAKELFFDETIDFNRFKVLGLNDDEAVRSSPNIVPEEKHNFTKNRLKEVMNILKTHPSLCEMFQGNSKC